MSSSRPLLEAHVEIDDSAELRRRNMRLEDELRQARAELAAATRASEKFVLPMRHLRQVLNPLYQALKEIYGELDSAGVETGSSPPVSRATGVWDSWKSKLGGKQAEFIQAMLEHGHPMTAEQLRVATHTGRSTVPQIIYKLNSLGLINKNDGKYSLKEL